MLTSTEVCERTGATYRQLDYWTRIGALVPVVRANGSGTRRLWSAESVAVVRAMLAVMAMASSDVRARLAQVMADGEPPWELVLGDVLVSVEPVEP